MLAALKKHVRRLGLLPPLKREKEPWQIVAARFCVERKEFTLQQLQEFLKKPPHNIHEHHIRNFFTENIQHPAGRQFSREFRKESEGVVYHTAPTELVSMITDFDELREARNNAANAWTMALWALIVGIVAAFFQLVSVIVQVVF